MIVNIVPLGFLGIGDLFPVTLNFAAMLGNRVGIERKEAMVSDNEFVRLTRKNNKAFSSIIQRYQDPLLRYIIFFCDTRSASSLIQEIFVSAYVNLNEYDESISFSSWIYRITHKEIAGRLKESKLRHELDDASFPLEQMAKAIIAVFPDWEHYSIQQLVASVQQLQGRHRDIMVLKYSEGKSSQEISDILELNIDTVSSLTRLAEDEINQYLKKA